MKVKNEDAMADFILKETSTKDSYRKRMIEERGAATVHGNKDDEVRYQESFKVIEFA